MRNNVNKVLEYSKRCYFTILSIYVYYVNGTNGVKYPLLLSLDNQFHTVYAFPIGGES